MVWRGEVESFCDIDEEYRWYVLRSGGLRDFFKVGVKSKY